MALTNAEYQRRWRERHQVRLTDTADEIAAKLIALDDSDSTPEQLLQRRLSDLDGVDKLRKIGALIAHHLKDEHCSRCKGTGFARMGMQNRCDVKRNACKIVATTEPFPCPVCRPVEYAAVSGADLRKEGRYAEAAIAAMNVVDTWSLVETLVEWKATGKEVQAALRELGKVPPTQGYIKNLRKMAERYPPNHRHPGLWSI
jgi:hypothetical protein